MSKSSLSPKALCKLILRGKVALLAPDCRKLALRGGVFIFALDSHPRVLAFSGVIDGRYARFVVYVGDPDLSDSQDLASQQESMTAIKAALAAFEQSGACMPAAPLYCLSKDEALLLVHDLAGSPLPSERVAPQ